MQVVIQHPVTKKFYNAEGEWVDLRAEAKIFSSCTEAAVQCHRKNFKADLLLTFDGSATDVKVAWLNTLGRGK